MFSSLQPRPGAESRKIESVLKTGLHLVYGSRFKSVNWALRQANMCTVEDQRTKMFKSFTQDCLKSTKFKNWFLATEDTDRQGVITRHQKPRIKPVYTRTSAYAGSDIPQMVWLANSLKSANTQTQIILNSGQIIIV